MPEHSLRFGVASKDGLRSDSWKCWTVSGTGKRDVYLLCRRFGNTMKLSMHESGRWHVGFGSRDLFDEDRVPNSRFLGKWDKPSPLTGPYILCCRVHIPSNAVSIPDNDLDPDVHWAVCAPSGQATEFVIFLTERPYYGRPLIELVGQRLSLVGTLPVEGGGRVFLASYLRDKVDLGQSRSANPGYFKGNGIDDMLKANRAVLWNAMPDGSIMFVETPVVVRKTETVIG